MAGCVSAVRERVRLVEMWAVEDCSTIARARKLDGVMKELRTEYEQLSLLKKRCSEREAKLERRLADVEKTREELESIQLGMKEKAEERVKVALVTGVRREEFALQRGRDAGQKVIELQIELAAERRRHLEAEEEVQRQLQCARAEAQIWKDRFRQESSRRLGQSIAGGRRMERAQRASLGNRSSAKDMTSTFAESGEATGGEVREDSTSPQSGEQTAVRSHGSNVEGQQDVDEGEADGHDGSNGEELGGVQLDNLQKVLASMMWPSSWDDGHRRQLHDELMRRTNSVAVSEEEWRTAFEDAVEKGRGVCLVPMLVDTIRSGYRLDLRSLKDSRRSCATHGKKVKRSGPCIWMAREVNNGSPQLVIKERT